MCSEMSLISRQMGGRTVHILGISCTVGEICHVHSWICINDVHQCLSETVCCIVTVINARWLLVGQTFESGMKRDKGTKKIPVHELNTLERRLSQSYIS